MKFACQCNFLSVKYSTILLLSVIMIIIIFISFYIMKIKLVPSINVIISKNQNISPEQKIGCIVYIPDTSGRLGNRMFLVASAYGLARLHSCHLYIELKMINQLKSVFILDLSPLLISSSTFNSLTSNSSKPMSRINKGVDCDYITTLARPNAISSGTIFELRGYWLSYLYFAKYDEELRQRIFVASQSILKNVSTFFIEFYQRQRGYRPEFLLENHQSFKKQLSQLNSTTWIGIHVRRSDFVDLRFSSSDAYLFDAVKYYTARYPNAHFIVTSDDKPYCEKLFRNQSNISLTPETYSTGDDLVILSLCQHSVITGGTYGWWTGYLAGGEVIHDKIYPSGCSRREYYYPPWFLIDGNVRTHKNTEYILR
ncbi:unnamed protein product [Adineta steineri]|uniref:L-Fucosyltransferase n=1 Tax=Adineta steineri TaxID=433720 RepID=A0A814SVZ2_9BILA|nr:unnamed protein product [Adineta steineri]CAF3719449.1 unnamed protein product [Adineta steineri]